MLKMPTCCPTWAWNAGSWARRAAPPFPAPPALVGLTQAPRYAPVAGMAGGLSVDGGATVTGVVGVVWARCPAGAVVGAVVGVVVGGVALGLELQPASTAAPARKHSIPYSRRGDRRPVVRAAAVGYMVESLADRSGKTAPAGSGAPDGVGWTG